MDIVTTATFCGTQLASIVATTGDAWPLFFVDMVTIILTTQRACYTDVVTFYKKKKKVIFLQ